jgi:3-dehydroquinate dehydratase
MAREPWRHVSVLADGCIAMVSGKGVEGYRDAIVTLRQALRP